MNTPSGLYLHCASLFLSYCLRVAAAYLACLALSRLSRNPRRRFLIWLGFMLGSGLYWVVLAFSAFPSVPAHLSMTGAITGAVAGATGTPDPGFPFSLRLLPSRLFSSYLAPLHSWLVPIAWNHAISTLGRVLAWSYLGGLFLLALMTAGKHIKLYGALRQGEKPSVELARLFGAMCRDFGVRRCQLLILENIGSPATAYWWRPRILLPGICRELGATPQVADVLHHELVHIVRRDYFWAGVSDALCLLLFFHPAAWQARKRMRLERELACDRAVVAARPDHRLEYAESLTRFARLSILGKGAPLGIDFAAAASFLTLRIRAILDERQKSSWVEKGSKAAACLALLGAFCLLCPALFVFLRFAVPRPPAEGAAGMQSLASAHAGSGRRKSGNKTVERPSFNDSSAPGEQSAIPDRPAAYALDADAGPAASGVRPNLRFALLPDPSAGDGQPGPAMATQPTRPAWGESLPGAHSTRSRISLSTIVYSTVGQIAARIGRGDRRHTGDDKDFQAPQPTPAPE